MSSHHLPASLPVSGRRQGFPRFERLEWGPDSRLTRLCSHESKCVPKLQRRANNVLIPCSTSQVFSLTVEIERPSRPWFDRDLIDGRSALRYRDAAASGSSNG
jgi:hypothetical protein